MILDKTDLLILKDLQQNARASVMSIAKRAHVSHPVVSRRIQTLIDSGIIIEFRTFVNRERLGLPMMVMVNVALASQTEADLLIFEKEIAKVKNVLEVLVMAGEWDYLLKMAVKDMRQYEKIHSRISSIQGVDRIVSTFVIRRVVSAPSPLPEAPFEVPQDDADRD